MTIFSRDQWFALPFALRQRWWRETDYGRKPPGTELRAAIDGVMRENVLRDGHPTIHRNQRETA